MRKRFTYALILCLWGNSVPATTILVYVSPQESVIAADSLSNRIEGGQRFVCKIVAASTHTLFMATGTGATENPHFNPYELAKRDALHGVGPRDAALKYSKDALPPLQHIWQLNRSRYFELAAETGIKPTGPQDFLFLGLTHSGLISAAGTHFYEDPASPPTLRVAEMREFTGEHLNDIFLYKSGVIENIPSDEQINTWINALGPPVALRRAIETQIKATPTLVGGPISVVRLGRDGSIAWLDRGSCP